MSSATWAIGLQHTPTGVYANTANWNTNAVPTELAVFGQSYMSVVLVNTSVTAGGWAIGTQPYTFIASNILAFNGQGIVGGAGSQLVNSGYVTFMNSANAGLLIYHNDYWMAFAGHSTAGSAIFSNSGDLFFAESSTAGTAHISVTKTGMVEFKDGATADAANLVTAAEGTQVGRVVFSGDGPAHNHKLTAGSFSGSGVFDLGANEVTVGGSNLDTTVTGQITGGGSGRLVKAGDGAMTLVGVNTYGGGTAIMDGQLIVNGLIGKVKVGDLSDHFGVLFGNGIVGAATVVRGQISAGPGIYESGRMSTGNLDLQRRALLGVDVVGIASAGAHSGYDQLNVTGKVKLAGLLSVHMFTPPGAVPRHTLTIINNDGKDKVSGAFSNGTLYGDLKQGDAFQSGDAIYSISYNGGSGNDVVLRSEGHVSLGTDGNDKINASTAPGGNALYTATKFADAIYGRDGDDTIAGGAGNDTIYSGIGKDLLNGGAGKDFVSFDDARKDGVQVTLNGTKLATVKIGGIAGDRIKNIENVGGGDGADRLTGDSKDNVLLGEYRNDTLKGGGGNDVLVGGSHKDVLEGGSGNDQFIFDKFVKAANADTIKDFHHGEDRIVLEIAEFATIGSKLDSGEFYAKAGATKAHDASDHVIYNTTTGKLYYDDDGKGGHTAVLFATLSGHPGLTAADFVMITGQLDIS